MSELICISDIFIHCAPLKLGPEPFSTVRANQMQCIKNIEINKYVTFTKVEACVMFCAPIENKCKATRFLSDDSDESCLRCSLGLKCICCTLAKTGVRAFPTNWSLLSVAAAHFFPFLATVPRYHFEGSRKCINIISL